MKKILLKDIWPIKDVQDHKIHFARRNEKKDQPLDAWVRNRKEWVGWQSYYPGQNDFNRPYIFSLMDFHPERDVWLFGGVFRVIGLHEIDPYKKEYKVELTERGEQFIGRLKLRFPYTGQKSRVNFEPRYEKFEVSEILPEPYSGRTFPGCHNVSIPFRELEPLVDKDREDWKAGLAHVNGVYLITDKNTGKRYVGSAYGEQGLWGRWKNYVETGDGGNEGLKKAIGKDGLEYARRYFVFTLLEFLAFMTPKEDVLSRETFWKEVLLTRCEKYGLNEN